MEDCTFDCIRFLIFFGMGGLWIANHFHSSNAIQQPGRQNQKVSNTVFCSHDLACRVSRLSTFWKCSNQIRHLTLAVQKNKSDFYLWNPGILCEFIFSCQDDEWDEDTAHSWSQGGSLAMLVLGKQLATKSKLNEEERKEEHDEPWNTGSLEEPNTQTELNIGRAAL